MRKALPVIALLLALAIPMTAHAAGGDLGHPIITNHTVPKPKHGSGVRPHLQNYIYNIGTPGSIYHAGNSQKLHQSWCNNGTPPITYYVRNMTTGNVGDYYIVATPNQCQAQDIQWNDLTPGVTYVAWYCDPYDDCSNQFSWRQ